MLLRSADVNSLQAHMSECATRVFGLQVAIALFVVYVMLECWTMKHSADMMMFRRHSSTHLPSCNMERNTADGLGTDCNSAHKKNVGDTIELHYLVHQQ
jgi:hypothetical protein